VTWIGRHWLIEWCESNRPETEVKQNLPERASQSDYYGRLYRVFGRTKVTFTGQLIGTTMSADVKNARRLTMHGDIVRAAKWLSVGMVTSTMILVCGVFGIIVAMEMLTHIDSQPPMVPPVPGYPAPNAAAYSPPPQIAPVPTVKPVGSQEIPPLAP
jgi:hypothetical protein